MTEELDVLADVVVRLETARLSYMVTGSIASSYYGQPRMTRDIDIVIEIHAKDVDRLFGLFAGDFYIDRDAALDAIKRQSSFNIIDNTSVIKVDFIVRKREAYRREEFKRRRRARIDGVEVAIVSPEDLVLSKLVWAKDSHSEVQLGDVRSILKIGHQLDLGYLEKWAKRLGVLELYRETLK